MTEDPKQDLERVRQMIEDPRQEREWIRQTNIAYAGLLGAGFIMVEPFLTAASLDVSGKICVVAWAVAIPLLAGLLMVGQQEAFMRRSTKSVLVKVMKPVGQNAAFVGIVAGFWHIIGRLLANVASGRWRCRELGLAAQPAPRRSPASRRSSRRSRSGAGRSPDPRRSIERTICFAAMLMRTSRTYVPIQRPRF